ncbi:GOLPH3/VPS74 family protein [Chondrinema litorale]|uniref:GOLPH3/VPS74 family protein n=1 Tax=Chondrinema litorale TaxID=2994555 RepID=UPI002542AD4D|nr:GPP34 family phosphoprotein [Chondrinema litorale]UZR94787.1 GPP34 family phosphoprotein [Chondrinema litorale]
MNLTLAEELLLIALDDRRGKLITSSDFSIDYCLAGALLFDLTFENKVILKDKVLVVVSEEKPQDSILRQAFDVITKSSTPENLQYWLNELCEKIPGLRYALMEHLVAKDVLYKVEKKLLKIFSNPRYLPKQGESEHLVRTRIREIILHNKPFDLKSVMLIGLVNAADLVEEIFPALNDLKVARDWIKQIPRSQKIHGTISETLEEIQSAVNASINVPIIVRT